MSIALATRFESSMAAPLESQASNPLDTKSRSFSDLRDAPEEIETVQLRSPRRSMPGRFVPHPKQSQRREYKELERQGLVDKAKELTLFAPRSPTAHARYVQALVGAGRVGEAVAAAETILELTESEEGRSGSDVAARYLAAEVLSSVGRPEEAELILATLPGTGPWVRLYAAIAANRGEYDAALRRISGHTDAMACSYKGYLLLALNRPQEALAAFRSAMRQGEDSPSVWTNAAFAFATLGSPGKAIRAAARAVALAPDDRQFSFNLASYLRASGQHASAAGELERLSSIRGAGDPVIAAALAHEKVAQGDLKEGLRVLRRAQHHHSLTIDSPHLAELNANLAVLRWRAGEIAREDLLDTIVAQIKTAGPTLPLARMLASFGDSDQVPELERIHGVLAGTSRAAELAPLTIQLLVLKGELSDAAKLSMEYASRNPLDVEGVVQAIYLLAYALGEYSEAGDVGLAALRRIPADVMLINNTAYALAMAGRSDEAGRVLSRTEIEDEPYLVATQGLVYLASGQIDAGIDSYNRSAELIRQTAPKDEREVLVSVLRANEALAIHKLGIAHLASGLDVIEAPESWRSDRRFKVLRLAAARVGVPWEAPEGELPPEAKGER